MSQAAATAHAPILELRDHVQQLDPFRHGADDLEQPGLAGLQRRLGARDPRLTAMAPNPIDLQGLVKYMAPNHIDL